MPRSSHSLIAAIWLALMGPACKGREDKDRDRTPRSQRAAPDAAPAGTRPHPREAKGPGAGELAGTWHGQATTSEHGFVSATVSVTAGGLVVYTVIARGQPLSGQLAIVGWDGKTLRLEKDGAAYAVAASLASNMLDVTVPGLGALRLTREQN